MTERRAPGMIHSMLAPSLSRASLLLAALLLPLGALPGWTQEKDPLGRLYGEPLEEEEEDIPELPLERVAWLSERGRHDEALAELKPLLAAAPPAAEPRILLTRLLLKTGSRTRAKATAAQLVELEPTRPHGYLFRAILLEEEGNLEEAARDYNRAVEAGLGKDPAGIEALVRRAELLSEMDAKLAQRELRRALNYYSSREDLGAIEFTWIARACRTVDRFPAIKSEYQRHMLKYARRMLDQALAKKKEFATAHLEAGRLALRSMNHPLAIKSFKRVVKRDPNNPDARVGLADALLASFFGGASKYRIAADNLQKALAVDSTHPGAHSTLARIAVIDGDYAKATQRLDQALTHRPGHVGLLAVRAAIEMIRGDTEAFAKSEQAVLKARPRCARFYEKIATLVQLKFRYREARDLARKALAVDPGYHHVLSILGVNLTRTGEEVEGRRVLARAFELDPFNVFVFNHLKLWERLDREYVEVKRPGFRLRVHKDELKVTTRYLADLVQEARETLGTKYGALPDEVLIELFPNWPDFSTRSVGLPGIPALGVCFGSVVTVLSSKEKKTFGAHSWGRTLWHEFAHVCTLTRSKNRVPRWLTEGLSVYEEPRGRKTWVREYDADLITLREFGLLLPVARLDEGFTKPTYPNQVMMSYYQGGMLCEFVTDTWRFEKLIELLDAYGSGKDTRAAIPHVFGLSCEDFDQRFLDYVDRRYARYSWRPAPRLQERAALQRLVNNDPFDVSARGALARAYALHGKDSDADAHAGITLKMAKATRAG
ncbi:MAG: tetratricopeptide repeat protein, partial [Planctomycetes bacterium]|nr:tetratricopeptide repeat protein [Planctomycetota bacterium]